MAVDAVSAISGSLEMDSPRAAAGPSMAKSTSGPSFGETLMQSINDGIHTVQNGEAASIQGLQGAMPPFKVAEAVMSAQRTLQQAISIRDKAVSAYQEISRMTI
jgi:flagellar hook-basal body complex protein FliE